MTDESGKPPPKPDQPGAVKHDARGNAVWQWAANTGRQALDSTSALLKKLDVPGMKLEDDKPAFRADAPGESPPKATGYNPYGTRSPPGKGNAPAARPAPKPVAPAERPSFLNRLLRRK